MRKLFVSYYAYSHGRRRRYLKKLFNLGMVTRDKYKDGYLYHVPNDVEIKEIEVRIK